MQPEDNREYVLTDDIEDELIELFPFIPDIIDRAKKDPYIIELLENHDSDGLVKYLES